MDPHEDGLPAIVTLAAVGRSELKVQRSRFLAEAHPLGERDEVRVILGDMCRRYHDCRHVCHGWRAGHGDDLVEGRSDAGEPAGTAGEPILSALRGADVTDALVVVARYFGGVKLGTGGLGRAYREAAAAALDDAPRRRVPLGREHAFDSGYELIGPLEHLLDTFAGRIVDRTFAAEVAWTVWLPADRWRTFERELAALSEGRIKLRAPE